LTSQAGACPTLHNLRWLECRAGDLLDFLRSADDPPQLVGLDCVDKAGTASLAWYLNSPAASRLRWLRVASWLSGSATEALASSPYLALLASLRCSARDVSAAQARAIAETHSLPCLTFVDVEYASESVAIELTRSPGIAWVGDHRSECEGELAELRQARYGELAWNWRRCLPEH
jgi:hypothetical protein